MALILNGDNGIVYNNLNQDIRSLLMPKNWIINGMFDVWQRGTTQTTSGYGSDDRWSNANVTSTKTHSQQSFTVGQTDVPNNPKYFSRTVVTSGGTAGAYTNKQHRIEDVTKFAGKQVAISFWAKADANKNISIELFQNFGNGGSLSVGAIGTQKLALTTTWQKFTKIVTIPSVTGKTIGDGSYTTLFFWFDAGSNWDTRTDSLGNQSGTFDIANVSLVEGSVAVECQNQPYADVLRECQKYLRRYSGIGYYFYGTTTSVNSAYAIFPHEGMRVPPALVSYNIIKIAVVGQVFIDCTSVVINAAGFNSTLVGFGGVGFPTAGTVIAVGSPNADTYLELSAEL